MLWFDVLAIGAPVMALVTSAAYCAGRRRERRELWPEAAAAERYKMACRDVLTWCCQDEFRVARLVAGHIMDHGEGKGQINAGTPWGDETCRVDGLREQLRRVNRETANLSLSANQSDNPITDVKDRK